MADVLDGKVEPEDVATSVGVDSQEQIVLICVDLDHAVQIATLEPRLKNKLFFLSKGRVHPLEGAVVNFIPIELVVAHRVLHLGGHTCKKLLFLLTLFSSIWYSECCPYFLWKMMEFYQRGPR